MKEPTSSSASCALRNALAPHGNAGGLGQQFGSHPDASQRRAQIVGDAGEHHGAGIVLLHALGGKGVELLG
jgi:hypothetical protein